MWLLGRRSRGHASSGVQLRNAVQRFLKLQLRLRAQHSLCTATVWSQPVGGSLQKYSNS